MKKLLTSFHIHSGIFDVLSILSYHIECVVLMSRIEK